MKQCQHCFKDIKKEAIICKHCGENNETEWFGDFELTRTIDNETNICPFCAEDIKEEAIDCKNCGAESYTDRFGHQEWTRNTDKETQKNTSGLYGFDETQGDEILNKSITPTRKSKDNSNYGFFLALVDILSAIMKFLGDLLFAFSLAPISFLVILFLFLYFS